jgi:hypothetical protein
VLGDAGLRDRLGRSAREVVEGWDWRYSIAQVRQVYQEAIRAFQPTAARLTRGQRLAQAVLSALVFGFGARAKDATGVRLGETESLPQVVLALRRGGVA